MSWRSLFRLGDNASMLAHLDKNKRIDVTNALIVNALVIFGFKFSSKLHSYLFGLFENKYLILKTNRYESLIKRVRMRDIFTWSYNVFLWLFVLIFSHFVYDTFAGWIRIIRMPMQRISFASSPTASASQYETFINFISWHTDASIYGP